MDVGLLIAIVFGVTAVISAVTAVAYPLAFPDAPKTVHRIVFLGGLLICTILVVAAVKAFLPLSKKETPALIKGHSAPTAPQRDPTVIETPQPQARNPHKRTHDHRTAMSLTQTSPPAPSGCNISGGINNGTTQNCTFGPAAPQPIILNSN